MTAQSGLGFSGIVAIQIPDQGAPGEVLTKITAEDYDCDWAPGGGGGGAPTNAEYVVMSLDATLTDERVLTAGSGITIVDGGAGSTVTISVDVATLNPLLDHGLLLGLADDDHLQYLLLAGRAGGQSAFGGTGAAEALTLTGSTNATGGTVLVDCAMEIDFDWTVNIGSNALVWNTTIPASGGALAGMIQRAQTITIDNALFITSTVDDVSNLRWTVSPGFAVSTLFFARPTYRSTTAAVPPAQAFIYAAQAQFQLTGVGDVTAANYRALSFAPIIRVDNNGDDMRITNTDGVTVQPLYNTRNANSTADYGTIRGVHMLNASTVLFGQALGLETCLNWIGLDVQALTGLTVTGNRIAVRSAIPTATANYLILNTGGAQSDFGSGPAHWNDNTNLLFGGTVTVSDVAMRWLSGTSRWEMLFSANLDSVFWSNAVNGQILMDVEGEELTINTTRGISFGAGTGTLGNQYFNFVQGAISAQVAGDFAGVLLTQGGSYTNAGFAMGRVSAWVINGLSYANSSGSVSEADTLTVGGMVTSSPGVTITDRQSLHVIAGRSRFDSAMQMESISPAALSAGDNDDWGGLLTGTANNGMRQWARISGNATTSRITGIDATEAQDGDWFTLTNIGSETILIDHEDTGSSASNRIICPNGNNFSLPERASVDIRRDATTDRWRVTTPPAAVEPLSGTWQFDSSTTMADPGDGQFRNNNGTIGSVTAIAIADETETGVDAGNILAALASGDQLYIQNKEDGDEFMVFDITSNTDNTGWHQIGGTVNASGSNFTDGKEFLVTAIFA